MRVCGDDAAQKPLSLRYIGSLVSDFHRNLLQGGIYMYPPTKKGKSRFCRRGVLQASRHDGVGKGRVLSACVHACADPKGKLRLLYECNPMALLAEQAGGKATDGFDRILDIVPATLHQRVPLFVGSSVLVEKVNALMKELSPSCRLHADTLVQ